MASLSPQERFAAQLAAAGITPEKPLHAILWVVNEAALAARDAAKAAQEAAQAVQDRAIGEVGQAVRGSLFGLQPEFERRWRWRRWAELIVAGAVGCAVMGSIGYATWRTATAVAQRYDATEAAKWQTWCSTPGHVVSVSGKQVCQVPLEQEGRR